MSLKVKFVNLDDFGNKIRVDVCKENPARQKWVGHFEHLPYYLDGKSGGYGGSYYSFKPYPLNGKLLPVIAELARDLNDLPHSKAGSLDKMMWRVRCFVGAHNDWIDWVNPDTVHEARERHAEYLAQIDWDSFPFYAGY